MLRNNVLVLFSGGVESTTMLANAVKRYSKVAALNVDYGALQNKKERIVATKLLERSEFMEVSQHFLQIPSQIMLPKIEIPETSFDKLTDRNPVIYSGRNLLLIALAVAYAHSRGYNKVQIGASGSDSVNNLFPDCTPTFLRYVAMAARTGYDIEVDYPMALMSKSEVIDLAAKVMAPLDLSYSCYRGGPIHCGNCPTCYARRTAFDEAGYTDPTEYKADSQCFNNTPKGVNEWPTITK